MSRPQRNATRKSRQKERGWAGPKRTPKQGTAPPEPAQLYINFPDIKLRDEFAAWLQGNLPVKFRVQR